MTAQVIRREGEPEYAVLPWEEYERLRRKAEAFDDVQAYDRAVGELDEDSDATLPSDVVHRISHGENPVKVWRQHHGLTQGALAEATGLSQSYIAMLEGGERKPGTAALTRLADALQTDLEDLLGPWRDSEGTE